MTSKPAEIGPRKRGSVSRLSANRLFRSSDRPAEANPRLCGWSPDRKAFAATTFELAIWWSAGSLRASAALRLQLHDLLRRRSHRFSRFECFLCEVCKLRRGDRGHMHEVGRPIPRLGRSEKRIAAEASIRKTQFPVRRAWRNMRPNLSGGLVRLPSAQYLALALACRVGRRTESVNDIRGYRQLHCVQVHGLRGSLSRGLLLRRRKHARHSP